MTMHQAEVNEDNSQYPCLAVRRSKENGFCNKDKLVLSAPCTVKLIEIKSIKAVKIKANVKHSGRELSTSFQLLHRIYGGEDDDNALVSE